MVWIACLSPVIGLCVLGWNSRHDRMPDLGANPIEYITDATGTNTLVLILITLAITPARRLTGWNWFIRFRRLLGLFAFFYGFLHLMTFVWLDKFFDWSDMWRDIQKRPFITAGMLAFTLLIPLAITSTNWFIRKMGGRNWNLLHKLIYISAISGVVHFWWKVKADHSEPATYGAILAALLIFRIIWWLKEKLKTQPAPAPAKSS